MQRLFVLILLLIHAPLVRSQPGMLAGMPASYVQVPHAADLGFQSGFTVEAWVFRDSSQPLPTSVATLVSKGFDEGFNLVIDSATGRLWLRYGSPASGGVAISTSPIPFNQWTHVAGTYNGSVAQVYVNGLPGPSSTPSGPPTPSTVDLRIANGHGVNDESLNGFLDDVRIWSVARSQIQLLFSRLLEVEPQPNLSANWRFNGNLDDATGNHPGFAVGTVQVLPATSPVTGDLLVVPETADIGTTLFYELYSKLAGASYVMDVSFEGSQFDNTLSRCVLTPPYLFSSLAAVAPPGTFVDFAGTFGADRRAHPTFTIPYLPSLTGLSLTAQFVRIAPGTPLGIAHLSDPLATLLTDSNPPSGTVPTVTAISPFSTPASGGWPLQIHGTNFAEGAEVLIDGSPALSVQVAPNLITCLSPPGSVGLAEVTVRNPNLEMVTIPNGLDYVVDLLVTSYTLYAPSNTAILVTGVGFLPGLSIELNGVAIPSGFVTSTSIAFLAPPFPPCSSTLKITNPNGQFVTLPYSPDPAISGTFSPMGSAAGGGTFFIFGASFFPGTVVTIGGNPATILEQTSTTLLVQAPPGSPGVAQVVVINSNGCSASTTYTYQ